MTGTPTSEATVSDKSENASEKPFLTIVKGNPTDEDVAVLVTVLAGAASAGGDQQPQPRDDWGRPIDKLRPALCGQPTSFTNLRW